MSISDALTASDLATAAAQQIVTFKVEGRSFGVPVGAVREIKGWQPTTPLPNSARHVLGVINLRGAIIAVYDLRQRLGLGPSSISRASVVVVIDLGSALPASSSMPSPISSTSSRRIFDPRPKRPCDGDDVLQGLLVRGDEVVSLLDLASLVREPSSMALPPDRGSPIFSSRLQFLIRLISPVLPHGPDATCLSQKHLPDFHTPRRHSIWSRRHVAVFLERSLFRYVRRRRLRRDGRACLDGSGDERRPGKLRDEVRPACWLGLRSHRLDDGGPVQGLGSLIAAVTKNDKMGDEHLGRADELGALARAIMKFRDGDEGSDTAPPGAEYLSEQRHAH